MVGQQFDAMTRMFPSALTRRGLGLALAGGTLSALLARLDDRATAGKKKSKKKKKNGCPRGQKKDPYGICGFPPVDCLTVGALCSGEQKPCCSEDCRLLDDEGNYRCIAGKARCLVDFGCVPGYICRGYRCQQQ